MADAVVYACFEWSQIARAFRAKRKIESGQKKIIVRWWRIRWDLNPGLSAFYSFGLEGRRALWLNLYPCCATDPFPANKRKGLVDIFYSILLHGKNFKFSESSEESPHSLQKC
jgi:hypothetical protein